jgi:hypothetical protein
MRVRRWIKARRSEAGGRRYLCSRASAVLLAVLLTAACTTRNARFQEIDESTREGEYQQATDELESHADDLYTGRDEVLYYLDAGMLHFYSRSYDTSIQRFHEAERLIEELFTRSITQAAGTLIINDTVQDYSGEDFEDIYLNVFKAVGFLQQSDFEGAFVEVRRLNNKLNLLEDKYQGLAAQYNQAEDAAVDFQAGESRFYNSALARYLSLIMYRADGAFDSARIDWQEIQEAFREQSNLYDFPIPFGDEVIQPTDNARLSVLAFTGEAPIKRAETLWVVTFDNRVDIVYASEDQSGTIIPEGYASFGFPGIEGGYRFKFQLPVMEQRGSAVERIRVVVNGEPAGELQLLEDMERIAVDTFQIRRPIIFLRTVTRTVLKGIASQRGREAMREAGAQSGSALGMAAGIIGSIATDVAVEATERADLRVSRFFPAYAYVGEWEFPPGTHRVEIEFFGSDGLLRVEDLGEVDLRSGELNFVTSYHTD